MKAFGIKTIFADIFCCRDRRTLTKDILYIYLEEKNHMVLERIYKAKSKTGFQKKSKVSQHEF